MTNNSQKITQAAIEQLSIQNVSLPQILLVCPAEEKIADCSQTEDGAYRLVWKRDVRSALEALASADCVGMYLSRSCVEQINDLNDSIIHNQILDALSSGVVVLSRDKKIQWCNSLFLDFCGLSSMSEALDQNFYHVLGVSQCLHEETPLDTALANAACTHAVLEVSAPRVSVGGTPCSCDSSSDFSSDSSSDSSYFRPSDGGFSPAEATPEKTSNRVHKVGDERDVAEDQENAWGMAPNAGRPAAGFAFDALFGRPNDDEAVDARYMNAAEAVPREVRERAFQNRFCEAGYQEKRYYIMHVSPLMESPWDPDSKEFRQLLVVLTDISEDESRKKKQEKIQRAGAELTDFSPQELLNMSVRDRISMLKNKILETAAQLMNFDNIEIRLADVQNRILMPFLAQGITEDTQERPLAIAMSGGGISGLVAKSGEYYLCEDTEMDPQYLPGLEGAHSSLTVPIRFHGATIGTFNVERRERRAFSSEDIESLQLFADKVGLALNTFQLLATEKCDGAVHSVDRVYREIALPMDDILNDTIIALDKFRTLFDASAELERQTSDTELTGKPQKGNTADSDLSTLQDIAEVGTAATEAAATEAASVKNAESGAAEIVHSLVNIVESVRGVKEKLLREREKLQAENPIAEEYADAIHADIFNMVYRDQCKPFEGMSVLFADESVDFRVAATEVLYRLGARVTTARTGMEAIALLEKFAFDTLIFDIRLPDMTGIDFIRRIKPFGILDKTAMVMLTGFGYDPSHTIPQSRAEGITSVLYKPFREDQITSRIRLAQQELYTRQQERREQTERN